MEYYVLRKDFNFNFEKEIKQRNPYTFYDFSLLYMCNFNKITFFIFLFFVSNYINFIKSN